MKKSNRIPAPIGGFGEPLVDEIEAARLLGVSRRWMQDKRWSGGGPPWVQCGRYRRYSPSTLREWVEQNVRTATAGNRRKPKAA